MEYREIREKLESEKNTNKGLIVKNKDKLWVLERVLFSTKLSGVAIVSLLVSLGLYGLIGKIGIDVVMELIPVNFLPMMFTGASVGISSLMWNLVYKFYKPFSLKANFSNSSSLKTEYDKLKEMVRCHISLCELENNNKVIDGVLKSLKEAGSYANIGDLSSSSAKQYEDLRNLAKKKVLCEEFGKENLKTYWWLEMAYDSSFAFIFGMVFSLPFSNLVTNSLAYFIPAIGSAIGSAIYLINKNKQVKKLFKELNGELGEDTLSISLDEFYGKGINLEKQRLNELIENLIYKLVQLRTRECTLKLSEGVNGNAIDTVKSNGIPPVDRSYDPEGNPHVKGRTVEK